ncbi:hypothetical protein J0670_18800, partial [Streptomyces sp. FH025]|nr:hypothetical protein [Streptomyces sp. FH025]
TATVGDCFEDNGTATVADLRSVDCGPGAYEVVRIFNGTTDLDSCKNVTASDESVSYRRYQRVLCLSYQSPAGNAYHAQAGDCVYGPNGPGVWHTTNCATGNFKVLATYRGAGDGAKCDGLRNYNQWKIQTGPNRDSDRLLCLSMNYPDDAGYATLNECLLKSGSDEKAVFTNVGSCAGSNVVVTGRSGTYDDEAFCQGYGWTTWRPNEYPKLAYTTCWRWK